MSFRLFPVAYVSCVAETGRLESVVLIALRPPLGLEEAELLIKLAFTGVKYWMFNKNNSVECASKQWCEVVMAREATRLES